MMNTAAQDYEQAKAASLLYQCGDAVYGTPAEGRYDAACDAAFASHGSAPYAVYNGKNSAVWG